MYIYIIIYIYPSYIIRAHVYIRYIRTDTHACMREALHVETCVYIYGNSRLFMLDSMWDVSYVYIYIHICIHIYI